MALDVSIIDRVFLLRSHILETRQLAKNCKVFVCTNRAEERHVILKFRYAGNTQYHRVHEIDFEKFAALFSELSP